MIPPGGEGQIKVTLRPKGRATTISKTVVVHSDDPEQPEFRLTMKGKLLVDVVAVPRSVRIRDLKVGAEGAQRFELHLNEGSKAEIVSATIEDTENFTLTRLPDVELAAAPTPDPALDSEGSATAEPISGRSLGVYEVKFRGRDSVGTTSTKIFIETTGANTPKLELSVHANAAGNLRYLKSIRFLNKDGEIVPRELHLSSRHGERPEITRVEDPDGLLDFEILPPKGKLASVSLAVRAELWSALDDNRKRAKHDLIVHTTDPEEPRITVSYSVASKSKRGSAAKVAPMPAKVVED